MASSHVALVLLVSLTVAWTLPLADRDDARDDSQLQQQKRNPKIYNLAQLMRYYNWAQHRLTAATSSKATLVGRHSLISLVLRAKRKHIPLTARIARLLLTHSMRQGLAVAEHYGVHVAPALSLHFPGLKLVKAHAAATVAAAATAKAMAIAKARQLAALKHGHAVAVMHRHPQHAQRTQQWKATLQRLHATLTSINQKIKQFLSGRKLTVQRKKQPHPILAAVKQHLLHLAGKFGLKRSPSLTQDNVEDVAEDEARLQDADAVQAVEVADDETAVADQYDGVDEENAQDEAAEADQESDAMVLLLTDSDNEGTLNQDEAAEADQESDVMGLLHTDSDNEADGELEQDFSMDELRSSEQLAVDEDEDAGNAAEMLQLSSLQLQLSAAEGEQESLAENQDQDKDKEDVKEQTKMFESAMGSYHAALARYHDAVSAVKNYISKHQKLQK